MVSPQRPSLSGRVRILVRARLQLPQSPSLHDVALLLRARAHSAILGQLPGSTAEPFGSFLEAVYKSWQPVLDQGIVVAGQVADDVCITGNSIRDCVQAIHLGLSASDAQPRAIESAAIERNSMRVVVPPEALGERHAIFVGSVRALRVRDNHAQVSRIGIASDRPIDAIRVWGENGPYLQITGNDVYGFSTGIRVRSLGGVARPAWRVADNLCRGATTVFDSNPTPFSVERNQP